MSFPMLSFYPLEAECAECGSKSFCFPGNSVLAIFLDYGAQVGIIRTGEA
jgi:hypothetical protein